MYTIDSGLSYAAGPTEVPLIEQTIGDFFDAMADAQPRSEALVCRHEGKRYTYRELQIESNRLASALLGLSTPEAPPADLTVIPPALRILWPDGPVWFSRFCEYQRQIQGDTELNAYLCKAGELLFGPS